MKMYPKASAQDALIEIFPDVYLLRGSIRIAPLLQMHRNMIVIRHGSELSLINAVRLNEENLTHLNRLGHVKHVIRLGDFHGLDDQFYIDHYQASFWSQAAHHNYPNLIPEHVIHKAQRPPIPQSQFFIFHAAQLPEAALYLESCKLLITTDSVQYWNDWKHTSFLSKIILSLMGFRLGLFIGHTWLKQVSTQPNDLKQDFQDLMALDFQHLVAAHGDVLKDNAKSQLTDVIAKTFN